MDDVIEVEHLTQTKRRILANRKERGITPEQVFVKHSLHAVAEVAHRLGSHAALAFLAILGTRSVVTDDERREGFTVRDSFRDATQLEQRQFRRAVSALAAGGYIKTEARPGRKPRITLTQKGQRAIPGGLRLVQAKAGGDQ
jgi:hypothetical protein